MDHVLVGARAGVAILHSDRFEQWLMTAFDLATGESRWTGFPCSSMHRRSQVLVAPRAFHPSYDSDGFVYATNLHAGGGYDGVTMREMDDDVVHWTVPHAYQGDSSGDVLFHAGGTVVAVVGMDKTLTGYSASDGEVLWKREIIINRAEETGDGRVILDGQIDNSWVLAVIDLESGDWVLHDQRGAMLYTAEVSAERIAFVDAEDEGAPYRLLLHDRSGATIREYFFELIASYDRAPGDFRAVDEEGRRWIMSVDDGWCCIDTTEGTQWRKPGIGDKSTLR